jgi:hypothetical protein
MPAVTCPRESDAAAGFGDDHGFLAIFRFALLSPADEIGRLSMRANPRRRSTRMHPTTRSLVDELSGHYGERRKASSRCLPNARGHEQKAQRGQKHADSQRTADQGGADGKRPGSNESDHDFHDTHQGGEGSDAKNRIGPAHQRTIGGKAGDSLSLVRCDFVPPIHKRTRTRLYRMVYLPTASTVCAQVEDIASRPSSCCLREMLG